MTPDKISKHVAIDRLVWVDRMLREIKLLPLDSMAAFLADNRNLWSAESCLRRALEAVFDLGRHILAKGFGEGVSEYKEIASRLNECGILSQVDAELLRRLAGYRNRLVHFYHEVGTEELYEICTRRLGDVEHMVDVFREWLRRHPDYLDEAL